MEKGGENQLDGPHENENNSKSQGGKEHSTYNKSKEG